MRNAIILAAGKSQRFAPFTYEKPKGLFKVRGEILINRQIEQLIEAGVNNIYVVVGYMKEKFFYLEKKYPQVRILINNTFGQYKGNLYSLYVARNYMSNTYICCADHYFVNNPFLEEPQRTYRACVWKQGKFREFSVAVSDADVITSTDMGGRNAYAMVGHAFFSERFSNKFRELLEEEIDDFGVPNMFWESFYNKHRKELTLFVKYYKENEIQEFESIDDLRQFDEGFFDNIDSAIVKNICSVLKCEANDIEDIQIIQKGLTNVSFKFSVKGIDYVYRHPGINAPNVVDRKSEVFAQYKAKELGLDPTVIYIDIAGWKLSYYVHDLVETDLGNDANQMRKGMQHLRTLHETTWNDSVRIFDTFKEGCKLIKIACASKGNLFEEFAEYIYKAKTIDSFMKNDGYRIEALCHNDVYDPNYLVTSQGDVYLIDWEFAGINDKANDVASICSRYDFTREEIENYFKAYADRELTLQEYRHYWAAVALNAFYYFCWAVYKGGVNEDDGFFFLATYHNMNKYMDEVISLYEN